MCQSAIDSLLVLLAVFLAVIIALLVLLALPWWAAIIALLAIELALVCLLRSRRRPR